MAADTGDTGDRTQRPGGVYPERLLWVICTRCGEKGFTVWTRSRGGHAIPLYCDSCRRIVQREQALERNRKRRARQIREKYAKKPSEGS